MKEIGGYLELEQNSGNEFHSSGIALNSARNCLRYLIRARKIKKIWLPKFLCSVISDTCLEENVDISYYPVDISLTPIFSHIEDPEDYVYFINYYGQYSNDEIRAFSKKYSNLIVDNVQAFYTPPIKGLDTIYTCRKFFGVPDGAYLYTDCILTESIPYDKSYDRLAFLAGRLECSANEFYNLNLKNENLIDSLPLRKMSKLTHNMLRGVDYGYVKKCREQNFKFLHERLKTVNQLNIVLPPGPYMYPLLLKQGNKIREKLLKKKIYIPTLWKNIIKILPADDIEYKLAKNILPLPCDQRYGGGGNGIYSSVNT